MSAAEGQEVVQQVESGHNLVPAVSTGSYMAAFPQQPLFAWDQRPSTVPTTVQQGQSSPLNSDEPMQGGEEGRPPELVDQSAGFFVEDGGPTASVAVPIPAASVQQQPIAAPAVPGVVPAATTPTVQMDVQPGQVGVAPTAMPVVSLEDLRSAMQQFVADRDWDKFHFPRNLLLAMVGEVGELSEIFQWRGEVDKGLPSFSPEEKEHVAQELADILLYIIRLADVCGIDLGQAAYQKLQINSQKYPPDPIRYIGGGLDPVTSPSEHRGTAAKYATYQQHTPRNYEASRHKTDEESGRKRQRERFTEDQVAAMTQLAERAGWSITAICWEERVKFCEEYGVTKERLSNFFNNRKPKDLKKGRNRTPSQQTPPQQQPMHDMSGQDVMSPQQIKAETAVADGQNAAPANDAPQPQAQATA